MKPLAEIASLYARAIIEKDVKTEYQGGVNIDAIRDHITTINDIVNIVSKDLGVLGIHPMKLNKEKGNGFREHELGKKIKSSLEWKTAFTRLINNLSPDLDSEEYANYVYNPDWNNFQIGFVDEKYFGAIDNFLLNTRAFSQGEKPSLINLPSSLNVTLKISHSYFDQFNRNSEGKKIDIDPLSVLGILRTSDEIIPIGLRAGSFEDTIMGIPAGSTEPLGDNPLFNSIYHELKGETGLNFKDTEISLVGRAVDYALQQGGPRSYFVFDINTRLSYKEVLDSWENAKDQREHKFLIPLLDNPSYIKSFLKKNQFDYGSAKKAAEEGRPFSKTISKNIGTILPPCTISTLTYLVNKQGPEWAKQTEEEFNGNYKLTFD